MNRVLTRYKGDLKLKDWALAIAARSTMRKARVALARRFELAVIDDLGSGAVFDISDHGLPFEPPVSQSIRDGADLVCFSGDKLLGGPQCGIIVGRADLVSTIGSSPLMRTYRVDKLTLAALEATLKHYIDQADAISSIPALSMLTTSTETLAASANELSPSVSSAPNGL